MVRSHRRLDTLMRPPAYRLPPPVFRLLLTLAWAVSTLAAQQSRARIGLPGYKDLFSIEDVSMPFELRAPAGKSFAAVKAAFADLKVPVTVDDSAGLIVGNMRLTARFTFGDYRLSKLFDCGMSSLGQNADRFRLTFVFLALLDSTDATHTKLRVGLIAGGVPVDGPSRDAVTCGSTGMMEAKLVELATKRI
jgi:hypothetical protein